MIINTSSEQLINAQPRMLKYFHQVQNKIIKIYKKNFGTVTIYSDRKFSINKLFIVKLQNIMNSEENFIVATEVISVINSKYFGDMAVNRIVDMETKNSVNESEYMIKEKMSFISVFEIDYLNNHNYVLSKDCINEKLIQKKLILQAKK